MVHVLPSCNIPQDSLSPLVVQLRSKLNWTVGTHKDFTVPTHIPLFWSFSREYCNSQGFRHTDKITQQKLINCAFYNYAFILHWFITENKFIEVWPTPIRYDLRFWKIHGSGLKHLNYWIMKSSTDLSERIIHGLTV